MKILTFLSTIESYFNEIDRDKEPDQRFNFIFRKHLDNKNLDRSMLNPIIYHILILYESALRTVDSNYNSMVDLLVKKWLYSYDWYDFEITPKHINNFIDVLYAEYNKAIKLKDEEQKKEWNNALSYFSGIFSGMIYMNF
jgi:hypothetical protein